jgi:hypothetical protein
MALQTPPVLDLHRAMHQNLRLIREGDAKNPSELFDRALQHSAQIVLMLAGAQNLDLNDRIELLFEAGDFAGARRALDEQMKEWAWHQRWMFNRQHSQLIKAIRRAVSTETGPVRPS